MEVRLQWNWRAAGLHGLAIDLESDPSRMLLTVRPHRRELEEEKRERERESPSNGEKEEIKESNKEGGREEEEKWKD